MGYKFLFYIVLETYTGYVLLCNAVLMLIIGYVRLLDIILENNTPYVFSSTSRFVRDKGSFYLMDMQVYSGFLFGGKKYIYLYKSVKFVLERS